MQRAMNRANNTVFGVVRVRIVRRTAIDSVALNRRNNIISRRASEEPVRRVQRNVRFSLPALYGK